MKKLSVYELLEIFQQKWKVHRHLNIMSIKLTRYLWLGSVKSSITVTRFHIICLIRHKSI
jgi:hypothetical protein